MSSLKVLAGASRMSRAPRFARARRGAAGPLGRISANPALEKLEDRRLLAAVVSETEFLADQKSGIPVSSTDLINGLVPAPSDTNYIRSFEGGPIDNLTDGKTAANPSNLNEFSAQQNAVFSLDAGTGGPPHGAFWFATYRLPLASAPAGYDITEIESITGHQDARSDQTIDIEVQFVGDDAFYSLSDNNNFAYRPGTGNGAARLQIADDSGGALARGVRAIRFQADQEAVYRELDVFGTPTPPPTSGPAAPTGFTATTAGTDVVLRWTDQSDNEAGFRLERADLVGGEPGAFTAVGNVSANNNPPPGGVGAQLTFTDSTTEVGRNYRYRLIAFNAFNGGTSSAAVTADATTPTTGAGLAARYFPVTQWKGNPVVMQIDPDLSDNAFGNGSPHPAVPADQFSAIYSGTITPTASGFYTFDLTVDDVGVLFIGGGDTFGQQLVSDNTFDGSIALTAGQTYQFVFLASENFGAATFNLQWIRPGGSAAEPVPASVFNSQMAPVTAAPTGVGATATTPNLVTVSFTDNAPNEVKLQLERATVTGGTAGAYSVVAEDVPNSFQLLDATVNPSTTYSYRVRAFNFEGSAVSDAVQVTTPARTETSGATGAWYNTGFWGLPGRPPQSGLAVTTTPTHREEVLEVYFPDGSLDRTFANVPADNYSTVFTGKLIAPETGEYRILGFGDDDTHVFVDGVLVSSDPGGHGTPANTAAGVASIDVRTPITLQEGQSYNFVLMHAEQAGGAAAIMRWITPTLFASSGESFAEDIFNSSLTNISDLPVAPGAGAAETATSRTATINFQDNSTSELRYKVEQSTDPDFATIDRTFSAPINAGSFTVTGLNPSTTYYFRIRGTNLEGEGPAIVEQVTTSSTPVAPAAPTGLVVRTTNDRNFTLRWTDVSTTEEQYVILRRLNNTGDFTEVGTVGPDVTVFQDQIFPAPPRNTPVTYRVVARNAEGTSAPLEQTVLSGFPGGTGLNATAYANTTFTDDPANPDDTVTYVDPEIGENWSLGPPVAGIPENNFSVIWTGQVQAEKTEAYTFQVEGDDQTGLRITDAAGNTLVDLPLGTGLKTSTPVNLVAGQRYDIEMRHVETADGASAFLRWSSPTTPTEVIPQVFLFTGPAQPVVSEVYVRGSAWNANFKTYMEGQGLGDDVLGYRVDDKTGNQAIVPWANVNEVVLRYAAPPSGGGVPAPGTVTLTGDRAGGNYTVTAVNQIDPQTFVLVLDRPLGSLSTGGENGVRVQLTVPQAGPGGSNYTLRLDALQGDTTRSGAVLADDFSDVKKKFFRSTAQPGPAGDTQYTVFHDVNGSGSILADDFSEVKKRFFDSLQAATASAPAPAPAASFSTTRITQEVLSA